MQKSQEHLKNGKAKDLYYQVIKGISKSTVTKQNGTEAMILKPIKKSGELKK